MVAVATKKLHAGTAELWGLVRRQHGVISRRQLLSHGLSPAAIRHRLATGRLHPLWRGVYVVGRPDVGRYGRWMGAVLSCGGEALLSHAAAAALWGLQRPHEGIDVVVPTNRAKNHPGIRVHRRTGLDSTHRKIIDGIPVTDVVSTLLDLATDPRQQLERAVNEADRLGLIDPEALRAAIEPLAAKRPGRARLRALLDSQTFALTDSELERRFLRLAQAAGLPAPLTQVWVNGFRVDFHWPDLGLVVETDGLQYHRTAAQQGKDRLRDQVHTVAGLAHLRFTAWQVRYEPDRVRAVLTAVVARIRPRS
jgi:very-short-patch-repair endonuclease